jgi:hypothetical protein
VCGREGDPDVTVEYEGPELVDTLLVEGAVVEPVVCRCPPSDDVEDRLGLADRDAPAIVMA